MESFAVIRTKVIKQRALHLDVETHAFLTSLTQAAASELVDELSEEENWVVMQSVIGILTTSNLNVKQKSLSFKPKTKAVAKWLREPSQEMVSAVVFHLETSKQHHRILVQNFVTSQPVMNMLAQHRAYRLLSKLLAVWLTMQCTNKNKQQKL